MNQMVTVVFLLFCKWLKQNISHLLCVPAEKRYIFSLANPEVEFLAKEKVRSGREKLSQQRNICRLLFCLSRAWHIFSPFSISSSLLSFLPPSHPTGIFFCLLLKDDLIEYQKKKEADWIKNARWKPPAQKVLGRVMRMWWNGKIKWEWGVWILPCQNREEYVWEMQYISGNP